jgi:O-antigen/teichoic acid export membrane protein
VTVGPGARREQTSILRETVAGSAVLGVLALFVGAIAGHSAVGLGTALGLVIGSSNGYLVIALLDRDSPFVFGSLMRLAALSAMAIGVALVFGSAPWSVLIGVAAAQVVMVAMSVRQGLRA